MNEPEYDMLVGLTRAAWPLTVQVLFALGLLAGYYTWSRIFYRSLDRPLRSRVGRALGANIIWVLRHSSAYQTRAELGFTRMRYTRWTWGIEAEGERTFLRDSTVNFLSLLFVNVLAGLWPIALFFYVFLQLKGLSYAIFLPTCMALIVLYSAFWSGRYELAGMR